LGAISDLHLVVVGFIGRGFVSGMEGGGELLLFGKLGLILQECGEVLRDGLVALD